MPRHDVTRVPVRDRAELTATAARRLADLIVEIQSSEEGGAHGDGIARIVLTGGGAGIGLLRDLRSEIDRIDPQRIHLFFGDERNVPVDDPESNEGQARSALLDEWGLPEEAVHGYGLTGGDMGVAVEKYRRDLELFAPLGFDVHLLGMGGEGHINSLFPHSAALTEEHELVLPVTDSPKPPAERVTLTMEAVKQADRVWLLVSGEEKAEAAAQVLRGGDPLTWPAAGAQGRVETLLFLAEDAAGGGDHA
ncbi:6-phosphogluconolactonase [Corynebacterium uropygiale]|uniref:6-phosphogluconolactonase n=1 Tax=Corynebacterium uropygiale TaxID=1775911 RepID=A0A9X1QRP1_9CORY|nr:6-phosphogluconolactonase [Corynebacterium uropygiale]MCF4006593.1 6-phosphogluconolactonase [Corynebacterium uropygiale]